MIDLVREYVDAVNSDPDLAAVLGDRVFGFRIPEDAVPPLAVVQTFQYTPAARPTTAWWRGLVSVDFHSENPGESLALAARMTDIAATVVGVRATCVITDSQVESRQPVVDDGWTPTRFRQVVTVDVTAREP